MIKLNAFGFENLVCNINGRSEVSDSNEKIPILLFIVEGDPYSLPLDSIRYVVNAVAITPIPSPLPAIEGVVNIHGDIAPVIDMRRKCGRKPRPLRPTDKFIVLSLNERLLALHVDEIAEIISIDASKLIPANEISPGLTALSGILKYGDQLSLLYNPSEFFKEEVREYRDERKPSE